MEAVCTPRRRASSGTVKSPVSSTISIAAAAMRSRSRTARLGRPACRGRTESVILTPCRGVSHQLRSRLNLINLDLSSHTAGLRSVARHEVPEIIRRRTRPHPKGILMAESADPTLRQGSLGVGDIVFFVVSAAAPLLVMAGVAPYAILKAGLGVPDAYLFAGVVLAVFAVGFTTMSKYVPNAGAFYAYVTKGMGRPAGVAAALTALMSYNALQIGMYGLLGVAAQATFASLWNINLPWPLFAFAGIVFVWFLGYKSVHFGARVLAVFLTAESAILLLLAIAILVKGGASGIRFDSFTPAHALNSDTGSVLAVAFAAFMGFESTVIYRAEARDPKRTIPRATYIAVGFLALFYGFIVWTIIQAFGADKVVAAAAQDPAGLFFTAATQYLGTWAADTMHVLMISSVLASLLAFHNAVNRYTLAIADEGMLPSGLGRIHPRTGSPYVAGILQTVLAAIIVGGFAIAHADPYLQLLIWVNTPGVVGLVLLQVMVALSA